MAKFVVAGKVDCAAYARAEMLAEQMQFYLPDFHVHKVSTVIVAISKLQRLVTLSLSVLRCSRTDSGTE